MQTNAPQRTSTSSLYCQQTILHMMFVTRERKKIWCLKFLFVFLRRICCPKLESCLKLEKLAKNCKASLRERTYSQLRPAPKDIYVISRCGGPHMETLCMNAELLLEHSRHITSLYLRRRIQLIIFLSGLSKAGKLVTKL